MKEIHIFSCHINYCLSKNEYQLLVDKLPQQIQSISNKYHKSEDRIRFIIGRYLLLFGLEQLKLKGNIDNIRFTSLKKPYLSTKFDFNISHSGQYVICAFVSGALVGVDIELIKEVNISDFSSVFSEYEINEILENPNPSKTFFKFWTLKESFIKAEGSGFYLPVNNISIKNNTILHNHKEWFSEHLFLSQKYATCVCCNHKFNSKITHLNLNEDFDKFISLGSK